MAVATIGFNASLWMRHKAMAAARSDWSEDDFVSSLKRLGTVDVIVSVRREIDAYCSAGLTPRAEDDLARDLLIDPDEIDFIVERLFRSVHLPGPTVTAPEQIAQLVTVGDLAVYIQRCCHQLSKRRTAA